jgi:hypothetical protein
MNYQECAELIESKRKWAETDLGRGGDPTWRWLKNETRLIKQDDEYIVELFGNDIMVYRPDGSIVLDSCGWRTVTTKQRFNEYLGREWGVYQSKSIWYVDHFEPGRKRNWDEFDYVFEDGMILCPDGSVEGEGEDPQALQKLNRRVVKYTRDYIAALFNGDVPAPSRGDCWMCSLVTDGGRPLGDACNDDHLHSHMEERYYVPSLLINAVNEYDGNVSQAARWALADFWQPGGERRADFLYGIAKEQLRSVLRKYMRRRLGLAS